MGCPTTDSLTMMECLRTVDAIELIKVTFDCTVSNTFLAINFYCPPTERQRLCFQSFLSAYAHGVLVQGLRPSLPVQGHDPTPVQGPGPALPLVFTTSPCLLFFGDLSNSHLIV